MMLQIKTSSAGWIEADRISEVGYSDNTVWVRVEGVQHDVMTPASKADAKALTWMMSREGWKGEGDDLD